MRTEWRERAPREGWEVRYTPIGGRFSFDPSTFLGTDAGDRVRRALSQAMCAQTNDENVGSNDAKYLASVVTKIVQRGTAPRIFHADTSKIDVDEADFEDLVAAVVGRVLAEVRRYSRQLTEWFDVAVALLEADSSGVLALEGQG